MPAGSSTSPGSSFVASSASLSASFGRGGFVRLERAVLEHNVVQLLCRRSRYVPAPYVARDCGPRPLARRTVPAAARRAASHPIPGADGNVLVLRDVPWGLDSAVRAQDVDPTFGGRPTTLQPLWRELSAIAQE